MIKFITNLGEFTVELDPERAPQTCENFLRYVKSGFYNGTIMHRIVKDFVVQGGGFQSGMVSKKTHPTIQNEANKSLHNHRGTLAMARTSDPNSASSQYFINLKDNHFLNYTASTPQGWGYCVFGKVVSGMDIVDKMATVATGSKAGHQDVPINDIIIEKVIILPDEE